MSVQLTQLPETSVSLGLLLASVSRKAGGIFDAARRLAQELRESRKVCVTVWGAEDEYTRADLAEWLPVEPRAFPVTGPGAFGYSRPLAYDMPGHEINLLHTHGLWMYPSVATRRWARRTRRPYVVTPHGMLDPWALKNSRLKKRVAALLFENANLREASCLHALCEAEARAIRAYGLKNDVCVIPNGVDIPEGNGAAGPAPWAGRIADGRKVLMYLGRLHPKKGLPNLISAWSLLGEQHKSLREDWSLVIAGWDQGGHEQELAGQVEEIGLEGVHFIGPQFGDAKRSAYAHAAAFILPSYSEGLPMTVLEAWSYGLPVVMTRECNLPEGFTAGAAVEVTQEPRSIASGLTELFTMTDAERLALGARGLRLVRDKFSWQRVAADMLKVYEWILGGGGKPQTLC